MSGFEVEHMPNTAFRLMSFILAIRDILFPIGKRFEQFGIERDSLLWILGVGLEAILNMPRS